MRGFLDHARSGETDHASWLRNDNIAQRRKAGHHSGSSRVCKNRNVRKPFLAMLRECAACFRHLHQAQHSFVHARATGSSNNDHCTALGSAILHRSRNFLANDRSHGRREKTEVHHCTSNLVAVQNSIATDHSVKKASPLVVFFEPIRIRSHSLKTQDVHGFQVGIHFHERVRIEQILNPLLSRLCEVIVAARTDTLILRQLDFRNSFGTAGALLKDTTRNFPLFAGLSFNCWLLENCHWSYARAAVAARTESAPARFKTRAHSLKVEPVVRTSSINSTRKPRTSAFFRKRNALCKFSIRSDRSSAVCVVV